MLAIGLWYMIFIMLMYDSSIPSAFYQGFYPERMSTLSEAFLHI
jgi:hypothetical protein